MALAVTLNFVEQRARIKSSRNDGSDSNQTSPITMKRSSRADTYTRGAPKEQSKYNLIDDGVQPVETVLIRKRTQKQQDDADEESRRQAMKELVDCWNDRLQLISLITTFLASVEAGLLQVTAPLSPDANSHSRLVDASNACLMCALVIHMNASFMAFIGAFFLVRFKVKEAKQKEEEVADITPPAPSKGEVILDMAANQVTNSPETDQPPRSNWEGPAVHSANPRLVHVGPFFHHPPINLLSRCHFLCILCSLLGFVLAMAGIIALTWARHPRTVSIPASGCLVACLACGISVVGTNYDVKHFVYE
uniref:Transmembrane protein n=1 Tax=Moniliophthora roreri TaxID=221103 RepID=A0A0W0FVF8_MONRR